LTVGLRKKGNQNKGDGHQKKVNKKGNENRRHGDRVAHERYHLKNSLPHEYIAVVVMDPPAFRTESEMQDLVILSPRQVCGDIARN